MKRLLILFLLGLTFPAYGADTARVARFGIRCAEPFVNGIGTNYSIAGGDKNLLDVESDNGDITVQLAVAIDPSTAAVSVETSNIRDNSTVSVKSATRTSVTLAVGSCKLNGVAVLVLRASPAK